MANPVAEQVPTPDFNDDFSYWTFRDMHARRIVASRTDLHRKQRLFGFPKPVILTGGKGANALYKISDVKFWLTERERLCLNKTAPELRPHSPSRGRPRKDLENKKPSRLADATASERMPGGN